MSGDPSTAAGRGAARTLTVTALPTAHEVTVGDDLAAVLLDALADAGVTLVDGDVVAVASKVVAKAEGATVPLPPAADRHEARRQLALGQARRVVADAPWVLVVETHHGLVCANAGIDTSNVGRDDVALLLPPDPDASAAVLRAALVAASGADVGVLVTDTFGRPWRLGQTDVAIGAAGVEVLRDDRGGVDRHGAVLDVTMAAVGDALAAAADLVRDKADGTPFVLLRGVAVAGTQTAAALARPSEQDLFRAGGPTAAVEALTRGAGARRPVTDVAGRPPAAALLDRLTTAVAAATGGTVTVRATATGVLLAGEERELAAARTAALAVVGASDLLAAVTEAGDDLAVRIGPAADR